jgi:phosphopantothenoylcysteine decarboxylase/phosphopantothenate--cysteine ligase
MAHIDWARWATVIVVAPATANTIAKLAQGVGDDMLTTLTLASSAPLVIAPAMNPAMYASEATAAALRVLRGRAALVVEPTDGDVACGEHGQGKLASIDAIVEAVETVANRAQVLHGKNVLITSGPTQEPIDDARMLTNRSSGKMGAALARAAYLMGADVTVVSGPAAAPLPMQANVIRVRTALEMLAEVDRLAPAMDIIVGAAAVADYRPAKRFAGKMRRSADPMQVELVANPDVIAAAAKSAKPGTLVVGFAAEPTDDTAAAKEKLQRKGLSALALNDISRVDVGFESDDNELILLIADGAESRSGVRSKLECALWLFESLV